MTQCLKTFWKVLFSLRNPCFVDILSMSMSLSPGHDLLFCLFNEWIWFFKKNGSFSSEKELSLLGIFDHFQRFPESVFKIFLVKWLRFDTWTELKYCGGVVHLDQIASYMCSYFLQRTISQHVEVLSVSVSCITSLSNPIIYAAVNPQFRTEFHRLKDKVKSTFKKEE